MSGKGIIGMLLVLGALAFSCTPDEHFEPTPDSGSGSSQPGPRHAVDPIRDVMVLVSGGHNSLSSYLTEDLQEVFANELPKGIDKASNVLVVLSRLPVNSLSTTSAPVLYRVYADAEGKAVRDTLRRWTEEDRLFGDHVLREALQTVYDRYPAKTYGMVLSSHASGWLPEGYYNNPSDYEGAQSDDSGVFFAPRRSSAFPPIVPDGAPVKSIGQDKDGNASIEMNLETFVEALPIHLDYLLLDCCLSGCVEVAWALRGKCDLLGFSQTELLAEGFDYSTIVKRLLGEGSPNPLGVCEDLYAYYAAQSGVMQSATISLVDTRQMEDLAAVCAALFQKYRPQLDALKGNAVQGYFRYDRHFFYDLEDILLKAGIDATEQAQLSAALSGCVRYKAATPYFMEGSSYGFPINHHCGFSMYLPSMGTQYLDNYYKDKIDWNNVTKLVE